MRTHAPSIYKYNADCATTNSNKVLVGPVRFGQLKICLLQKVIPFECYLLAVMCIKGGRRSTENLSKRFHSLYCLSVHSIGSSTNTQHTILKSVLCSSWSGSDVTVCETLLADFSPFYSVPFGSLQQAYSVAKSIKCVIFFVSNGIGIWICVLREHELRKCIKQILNGCGFDTSRINITSTRWHVYDTKLTT